MPRRALRGASGHWLRAGLLGLALNLWWGSTAHTTEAERGQSRWIDGRITLGVSPEFSRGDYGVDEDTKVWYLPFWARYEMPDWGLTPYPHDRLSFKLTLPYLSIDGPDGVVSGTGGPLPVAGRGQRMGMGPGMGTTTSTSLTRHESGLGDIQVMLAYRVLAPPKSRLPWLTVSGKVKVPTASESENLGTGKPDYTVFLELYEPLGRFGFYAGAGYGFMGDSEDLPLDDRWLTSAGIDVQISSMISAGLGYDYREAVVASTSDAHELSPWIGLRPGAGYRIEPYVLFGLSNGSPDYGVGVRFSWSSGSKIRGSSSRRSSDSP